MWFMAFSVFFPVLAVVSVLAKRIFGVDQQFFNALYSSGSFKSEAYGVLYFATLAAILSVGPTFGSLDEQWQYAPLDIVHPIPYWQVLVASGCGGMTGSIWFGVACRRLYLSRSPSSENRSK